MRIALPPVIAPAAHDAASTVAELSGETMGTRWRVLLAAPPGFDAPTLERQIAARLAGIVAQMSQWEPESILSRFNRAAAGTWCILPADFAAVMSAGLRIAALSDGAFDPTLGRLSALWGFGAVAVAGPPDARAIEAARAVSGWRRLAWDAGSRCVRQPGGLWLDLAGIAKGHAVDAVADLLVAAGFVHCLVEIGGELVGRGIRPDGDPWWVDLEAPPGVSLPGLRIALHGIAVATSGDYRRGAHTFDARTGHAAASGITAVSVIAGSAMAADAWATALGVLGPEDGMALAARHELAARLVTTDGAELLSPALLAMLAD